MKVQFDAGTIGTTGLIFPVCFEFFYDRLYAANLHEFEIIISFLRWGVWCRIWIGRKERDHV